MDILGNIWVHNYDLLVYTVDSTVLHQQLSGVPTLLGHFDKKQNSINST